MASTKGTGAGCAEAGAPEQGFRSRGAGAGALEEGYHRDGFANVGLIIRFRIIL